MALPKTSIHKGFTLVEIIIVLAIFTLIISLGAFMSLDFYKSYSFRSEKYQLVSILQKARSQALNNINQTPHAVHIESGGYTFFEGNNFQSSTNKIFFESNGNVSHSGMTDVIFGQLTGNAIVSGGDLVLHDGVHQDIIISINNEGRIDTQ